MNFLFPLTFFRRFLHIQAQEDKVDKSVEKSNEDSEEKKLIVIGGGSGFIGTELCKLLRRNNYEVVVVSRLRHTKANADEVITWSELETSGLPKGTKAVVNLAGENVLDPKKSWTPRFQQAVFTSRTESAKAFRNAIVDCPAEDRPSTFVQISGVGYYAPSQFKLYDEKAEGGEHDFLAKVALNWEEAATLPKEVNQTRQVFIRSGVVLGRTGGMIANIFWQFFFGLGGQMGSGTQPFPWIHVKDLTGLILFSLENKEVSGVVNGVAPQLVSNQEFVETFANTLNRPCFLPTPAFLWNFIFGPERASMILEGQKVVPCKAMKLGYNFRFPTIDKACSEFGQAFYKDADEDKKSV